MSGQIQAGSLLDEHIDAVAVTALDSQCQGRRTSILSKMNIMD